MMLVVDLVVGVNDPDIDAFIPIGETAQAVPVQNGSLRFTRKATSPKSMTSHCNNQKGRRRPTFLFFAFLEEKVWNICGRNFRGRRRVSH
jgi:hypothetical protein